MIVERLKTLPDVHRYENNKSSLSVLNPYENLYSDEKPRDTILDLGSILKTFDPKKNMFERCLAHLQKKEMIKQ